MYAQLAAVMANLSVAKDARVPTILRAATLLTTKPRKTTSTATSVLRIVLRTRRHRLGSFKD